MTELPWVHETRRPPGTPMYRSPKWGIIALIAAGLSGGFVLIAFPMISIVPSFLPIAIWGVMTLAAMVAIATAVVQRGTTNFVLAGIGLAVVLFSNPVTFMLFITLVLNG
ncbi:hypothetical protein [Humidisolicoccus flavus]|uniref:hypothetical protein n=1 Tax=Humidisolicoccus flavus TaxID=3111414 RepID=UPI00325268A5